MKKIIALFIVVIALAVFPAALFAQSSSTVKTRVGNPSIQASSCPIPNSSQNCGSERVLSPGGCGHRTPEYIGDDDWLRKLCSDPGYPGIHYAVDVAAKPLDAIYMPEVNGKRINWTFANQSVDGDGITAILRYSGTDESNGDQFWIQFHHAKPGSGRPTAISGDQGGQVCQSGCKTGTGPHLHIEFAVISETGQQQWVEAPNYFCKN